ncbi:NrfD/PsrC family molybdoenzyme membrane anchor subunit [Rubrivirga sp. S365]|uniref:NrfD/PsrC family molybdoenzyme membrane anchor subunit n=1 Tax=Rubrivirga litoralis TaxID=3075598 RepID=A0ABU3BPX6_9BACT|nr:MULTISPECIES: NrfD/PsrC family molybdoenzyme membrane anchor subunit [unclassified Rubrivirga]MDT0631342.1 NrfD/PsrC family molybdoenzyme membrane anchor subunit [Rubrivirga sp. F394]MDT7855933.1 NrfD/PsrC family molybdoenzyme membrane anchor subunit [Rubrivirga sp. S365]
MATVTSKNAYGRSGGDGAPVYADGTPKTLADAPLVRGNLSFHDVTEMVSVHTEKKTPLGWWIAFGAALTGLAIFAVAVAYQVWNGPGVWGLTNPVFWGWAIVNFVWWVGIGHAGTLISAVLFLFRQRWRTSINRAAEAMTLFAVACALTFPTFHVGRVWVIYYTLPIPNQMAMWPQFKSPLLWDVFAVSIYGTVSLLFWYVGLIPDLATIRDRAARAGKMVRARILGFFSLGWTGSNRSWRHYERAYLLLAGLATPLVLSVHSVVSFDFAVSIVPGWHTTIFPPYFVAGAIFSGFAMVVTLMVVARSVFDIKNLITIDHLEKMNIIILVTGTVVGFAYITEFFIAWYSQVEYEQFAFANRAFGPYAWAYWTMMACNLIFPQVFWVKKFRRSIPIMFAISITTNIGMWFERFVITVTSLHRDFLPSSWDYYSPTIWDILMYVGTFGLFFTLFLLFLRFVPMVAIAEVKGVMPQADPHFYHHAGDGHADAHELAPYQVDANAQGAATAAPDSDADGVPDDVAHDRDPS